MNPLTKTLTQHFGRPPLVAIDLETPIPVEDLPTPALMVDLDVFERNLQKMQSYLASRQIALRGHAKMHKCPVIAEKQLASGARGICTATVSEAEVMLAAGIEDILITSPVMTKDKVQRVVALVREGGAVSLVVDNSDGADLLNDALREEDLHMTVYVDIDPGLGRTGVAAGEPALTLARYIHDSCQALNFGGLQMYAGHCMHIAGFDARRSAYEKTMIGGFETLALFEKAGINVPVFSGGGTGSFDMEADMGLVNELQAGSYLFMDVEYRQIGGQDSDRFTAFEPSLFVMVTAISQPNKRMMTVDAGYKAFASDTLVPEFHDMDGVVYHWGGDEHGMVLLNNPSRQWRLGDRLKMVTSHCDPTVNLYDYCFPYRNGMVEQVWPISARGCSQ
ncbi:MAG: DSD1 family PLP-dependent enzyme [Gammaproteobacteria bacterium]|nr:DSD1 family PLP-dependent enzyme [Gammaproteobacteria bacterium]